ncbi:iron-sulfur cluster carrier protein ApbC [Thalassotalea sp. 1_MG-2023]|uniref:iron-sulfur cluster carrier protein ApbC n=1 Tax=Thalassotalea sp. 1_MG-2023 TaxID=3062680 RepID=UPI0026E24E10|nr:iron-sulfur cluster carrier protein ApbC [Thalassotalea sp. 1_MG-2023]MDO6428709.1 iron-sulfur cluster carrier protein ApbC [Thalassotalea sp. 1_MG-2023]
MFSSLFGSSVPTETRDKITEFFHQYQEELFPSGIAKCCKITEIAKVKKDIVVSIEVPFACDSALDRFASSLLTQTDISILVNSQLQVQKIKRHNIQGIKNIIAIASGKGGVGKSTTTVNLAYALAAEGASVAILDADIYGPSIPKMLGLEGQPVTSPDGKKMLPLEKNEIAAMSIGFLVEEKDATVWRGPMASRAFNQLLNETAWQETDYLLIDMPPGTGDIQLTLAQQVPVAASVIITTPQDIALADAVKGIEMFKKVDVPVLGIIENMSYHICQHCGEKSQLFGHGGGTTLSDEFSTPLLGQLPLNIDICQYADNGKSPLIENSTSDIAQQYRRIAGNIAAELYKQKSEQSPDSAELFVKQVE